MDSKLLTAKLVITRPIPQKCGYDRTNPDMANLLAKYESRSTILLSDLVLLIVLTCYVCLTAERSLIELNVAIRSFPPPMLAQSMRADTDPAL